MKQNVLIVIKPDRADDKRLKNILGSLGEAIGEISLVNTILKERQIDLILFDSEFPGLSRAVVNRLRVRSPLTDIGVLSESGEYKVDDGDDYFDGSIDLRSDASALTEKVADILRRKALLQKYGLVGRSDKMKLVAETIDRIAPTDISVLIVGPSGSGKELVSRAIHNHSRRADHNFVAVNCGAIAEGILESELFGHEKGAFTGSVGKRDGLFVRADGGTMLLDEIGETHPDMQVKLLRVLEDGDFYPVGADRPIHSDVRIIAATNRDLTTAIADGQFREDLYFRLSVIKIVLPPLYDRREDILPLLYYFAQKEHLKGFSDSAVDVLRRYDWPGNVRQLRNFIMRMAALHRDRQVEKAEVEQFIDEQNMGQTNLPIATGRTPEEAGHELIYRALLSLGNEIRLLRDLITANLPSKTDFESHEPYADTSSSQTQSMQDMERELIAATLSETDGNRRETARKLGIGERTLYRKLKKYGLN